MNTCTHSVAFDIELVKPPIVWWGPDTLSFFTVYNYQEHMPRSPADDPGPLKWGNRVYIRGNDESQPLAPCDSPMPSHAFNERTTWTW